jgi:uncharacterized protein YjbI with pentapeptide repeats
MEIRSAETVASLRKVAVVVLFLAVLAGLLWTVQMVPEWQVRRASVRSAAVNPETKTTPAEVTALQNEMRKTVLQVIGGAFGLVALYLTYRRVIVAEQGHITDRFTKAIEQLGATTAKNEPNVEVRLGAIYALERIARDSPRDHWTIVEVLTAYVRQNAPAPAQTPTQEENENVIVEGPTTEIQAILTVLGRRRRGRKFEKKAQRLDLSRSNLRGANFVGAHMENANFNEAYLEGARFNEAHIEGASYSFVHAEGANFSHAIGEGATFAHAFMDKANFASAGLKRAVFVDAHMEDVNFILAHLEGARFCCAHMERAGFYGAHLEGADFPRACLKDAVFDETHLKGAIFYREYDEGVVVTVGGEDFQGAQGALGLVVEQFANARGWEQARYDEKFLRGLRSFKAKKRQPDGDL